jgi:tetratricopeptide (TPR) repeat protein
MGSSNVPPEGKESMQGDLYTKICFELGSMACERGDLALTDMLYKKGFAETDPESQSALAGTLSRIGEVHVGNKRYKDALRFYKKALVIYGRLPDSYKSGIRDVLDQLAQLYCLQGKYTQAAKTYERAMQLEATVQRKNHKKIQGRITQMAWLHLRLGNYESAQYAYRLAASYDDATEHAH